VNLPQWLVTATTLFLIILIGALYYLYKKEKKMTKPIIQRTVKAKKKPIVISGSVKETTTKRDYDYSAIPVHDWSDPTAFSLAVEHFIDNHAPPWTHAKLALELNIGSVKDLYAMGERGEEYKRAIDRFNLIVEDDLIRGSLAEDYHGKTAELYLKTYIKKYTDAPAKNKQIGPSKIQIAIINNKNELAALETKSTEGIRLLMDAAEQATPAEEEDEE